MTTRWISSASSAANEWDSCGDEREEEGAARDESDLRRPLSPPRLPDTAYSVCGLMSRWAEEDECAIGG